jgi:hypothetical protein
VFYVGSGEGTADGWRMGQCLVLGEGRVGIDAILERRLGEGTYH